MKTIIVPTDLSPETEIALSVAADIARPLRATIVLLHSVVYPLTMPAYAGAAAALADPGLSSYHEIEEEASETLKKLVANEKYADITIIPELVTNGDTMLHNVTEHPADLIVMTSKGASGLEEWLVGSNAEFVVRYAHCPVLIVKEPVAHFDPKNIVCAIDVYEALESFKKYPFALSEESVQQFLYVMTPANGRDPDEIWEWVSDLVRAKGITDFNLVIRGARTVPEGIIDYASKNKADLLVLFTHGYKGLRHFLAGSVAEDVVNHTHKPVLVMRM